MCCYRANLKNANKFDLETVFLAIFIGCFAGYKPAKQFLYDLPQRK